MKLIYAITVSTEVEEIKRLVEFLSKHTNDDIVVQYDSTKNCDEIIKSIKDYKIVLTGFPFECDYNRWNSFKNRLGEFCENRGGDYIFQLDADEMISEYMVKNIGKIIEINPIIDAFHLPRINTVDGITDEHVKKWNWVITDGNRINSPDYQCRVYRSNMKWGNHPHSQIINSINNTYFPIEDKFSILHHKTIEIQEKQNSTYEFLSKTNQ